MPWVYKLEPTEIRLKSLGLSCYQRKLCLNPIPWNLPRKSAPFDTNKARRSKQQIITLIRWVFKFRAMKESGSRIHYQQLCN